MYIQEWGLIIAIKSKDEIQCQHAEYAEWHVVHEMHNTSSWQAVISSVCYFWGEGPVIFRHATYRGLNHSVRYFRHHEGCMTVLHCHKLNQRELMSTSISAWNLQKRAELNGLYLKEKWQPSANPSATALKYLSRWRWRAGCLLMCYIIEFQLAC